MGLVVGRTVQINKNGFATIGILFVVVLVVFYGFNYSDNVGVNFKYNTEIHELVDLKDLLSAAIDAAQRGGAKVYEIRENAKLDEKSKGKTAEGANDPVTDGDMQSHLEMYHSLKNAFPKVKIISEERPNHKQDKVNVPSAEINNLELDNMMLQGEQVHVEDIQIWIDPLDATQEYTENLRKYVTTMVCVAVKGVPIIGVIHKPFDDLTAWVWVDKAHSPKIQVKRNQSAVADSPVKVIVSRSHKGSVVEKIEEAFGKNVEVTPAGGAGYKILEVISGRQDLYFHSTLIKKWDICAGNALLNHFEGRMTTLNGLSIDYSSPTDYKNPDGLVASLRHHMYYLKKLNPVM